MVKLKLAVCFFKSSQMSVTTHITSSTGRNKFNIDQWTPLKIEETWLPLSLKTLPTKSSKRYELARRTEILQKNSSLKSVIKYLKKRVEIEEEASCQDTVTKSKQYWHIWEEFWILFGMSSLLSFSKQKI